MKTILIAIFIAYAAIITGQSLTEFSQDSVLYLTDKQEAFMIDKETKYLFKTGPIGYERKISQSFSINTTIQPSYSGSQGLRIDAGAELRYYYRLSKLIEEGKQANNLSSEYFSGGVGYDGGFSDHIINKSNEYYLSWGSQKRFLNYGYFDYGLKLGYESYVYDLTKFGQPRYEANYISLSTRTSVGFAFGKNYKIDEVVKCPIFKCHLDRKSILKLNFNKVLNIAYGSNTIIDEKRRLSATFNPNIAYEYKLGASAFSIDQDLDLLVGFSSRISNTNPDAGLSRYRLGYTVALKHYFQLKADIRKGKTGNNLSGYYWFVAASFQYGESKLPRYDENVVGEIGKHKYVEYPFGVGYQKTMLDNYYFDFRAGLNLRFGESITPYDPELAYSGFLVDFKVGKLF